MRVTIVTNIPTPYRTPFYERVDALLQERGGALTVVYGARSEPRNQWSAYEPPPGSHNAIFLRRGQVRIGARATYLNPGVALVLRRTRPDVVVLGGYAPWIYAAAGWCRFSRVPYLVWNAETLASEAVTGSRRPARTALWRGAAGFLAYGPDAAEYLADATRSDLPITVIGNGIDVDAFAAAAESARGARDRVRREIGAVGAVVLNVGGKGTDEALAAFDRVDRRLTLCIVGAPVVPTDPRVLTLGRLGADEMPALYTAADCLVHLTRLDRWPHAINEALSAGTPVVASPWTGVPASVLSGPGCSIVEPRPADVADAIGRALDTDQGAAEAREAIRAPLRPWDVGAMAERFVAAAESSRSGA